MPYTAASQLALKGSSLLLKINRSAAPSSLCPSCGPGEGECCHLSNELQQKDREDKESF